MLCSNNTACVMSVNVVDDSECCCVAAVNKPLAEMQLISAKSGEGGANTDSDGFDDLDWTVWNRITL